MGGVGNETPTKTMKVILSGYEGSKKILAASSWLVNKYLPKFDIYWLNYGEYSGELFCGTYVSLKNKQESVNNWSSDIREFLKTIDDKFVIFSLDDYLLSSPINMELYNSIILDNQIEINLCSASKRENLDYSVTTQYTIWDRERLIDILEKVNTPWEFEVIGSKYFNSMGFEADYVPAMTYPDYSSLSTKWIGIKTSDNNKEDINWLKENNYL